VCQALTTTSSISDGEGGIKEHNCRILVVENGRKVRGWRV
jgi:hypothetical protein